MLSHLALSQLTRHNSLTVPNSHTPSLYVQTGETLHTIYPPQAALKTPYMPPSSQLNANPFAHRLFAHVRRSPIGVRNVGIAREDVGVLGYRFLSHRIAETEPVEYIVSMLMDLIVNRHLKFEAALRVHGVDLLFVELADEGNDAGEVVVVDATLDQRCCHRSGVIEQAAELHPDLTAHGRKSRLVLDSTIFDFNTVDGDNEEKVVDLVS